VASGAWSVTAYRGLDGLAAVEDDWRRLYGEMDSPSMWHSFDACRVYVETFCALPECFMCLALSDGESVRAIVPLEERMDAALGPRVRVWGLPSNGDWQVSDVVGAEGPAREALLPAIVDFLRTDPARPSLLVIGRTWDGSALWDGLASLPSGASCTYADGAEFVVPTDVPFEQFVERLAPKHRSVLRRAEKRFLELPDARYVRAVEPDDVAREFETFLDVEASGWKGAEGTAIKLNQRAVAFYRGLTTMTGEARCEIHAMYTAGTCVASEFCVYTRNQCATPKAGYAEEFASVSPGRLAAHKTIEWSCGDAGITSVSEVSDAPWLQLWRPESRGLRVAYIALRPASGWFLVRLMQLRFGLVRRLYRRLAGRDAG
jgi:hypothetical protein